MHYFQSIFKWGPLGYSWDARRHSQRHRIGARLNFLVTPVRVTLRLSVTCLGNWHQRITAKYSTHRETTGPLALIWETPSLARTRPNVALRNMLRLLTLKSVKTADDVLVLEGSLISQGSISTINLWNKTCYRYSILPDNDLKCPTERPVRL